MTINGPLLVTPRLILRPPGPEDLEPWIAFCADPQTMRFLGGPQTRSEAWRGLCTMAGAWHVAGFAMFSVIERASGRWIGRIGPWRPEGWPGNEVGWGIASAFAGQGYAHEAAAAAIDYAFDRLGWPEVIHCIDPDNTPSIALATRLGSRLLRPVTLPPPIVAPRIDAWGQSAAEWRARKAQPASGASL